MEDYLITFEYLFADSTTGEVISKSKFSKPLSVLSHDDITRIYDCFVRGVRSGKHPVCSIQLYLDRDLPSFVQSRITF